MVIASCDYFPRRNCKQIAEPDVENERARERVDHLSIAADGTGTGVTDDSEEKAEASTTAVQSAWTFSSYPMVCRSNRTTCMAHGNLV